MAGLQIILTVLSVFLLVFFLKYYLPSYLEEKAKNLATKEDIKEITRKTEEVQNEFREGFELFSSDVRFKYSFFYERYSKLYCNLYAIIMQSEYVRHFISLSNDQKVSFDEVPFIEVGKRRKIITKEAFGSEGQPRIEHRLEEVETPLSQFNKEEMDKYIIENGQFASPKLLKIAVSYRFAYEFYGGNSDAARADCADTANTEELRLIREMVCCIVSEYNELRKNLKMDYNEQELKTGIPTL